MIRFMVISNRGLTSSTKYFTSWRDLSEVLYTAYLSIQVYRGCYPQPTYPSDKLSCVTFIKMYALEICAKVKGVGKHYEWDLF